VLWYIKTIIFSGQMPKSSSKVLLKLDFFFMTPSIGVLDTQFRISRCDLQIFSLKVILKREWLNLVLDVHFMTLNILKLDFVFIFFEFIINLRAPLQRQHQQGIKISI
jgi:hypothetical protein